MKVPEHSNYKVYGRFTITVRAETAEDAKVIANELDIFDGSVRVFKVTARRGKQ